MTTRLVCILTALLTFCGSRTNAQTSDGAERFGLRRISASPFPVPEGSQIIALDGCDFETGKLPQRWGQGHGQVVTAADAPQGKAYFRFPVRKGADLRSPALPLEPGRDYFVSYWLRSAVEPWAHIDFTSDERDRSFDNIYPGIAFATGNAWRQVGFYFHMPAQCSTAQLHIVPHDIPDAENFVALDDIRLRTATGSEVTAAYEAERAFLPAYDVTSRPGDGKNLALSVAKWEGRAGIPGKPFVIWALGSSYTAWQGDGFELVQAIRKRFPNAPPIVYHKHGGPGTPWEYVAAWIKQFVAAEQPDLIFTYTTGTLDGLEELLRETRRHSTAEIIVPSVHFKPPGKLTPDEIEKGAGVDWAKAREICARHGAEFVENRREMAEYLTRTGLDMDALLFDHNHQNPHGRMRIWDNVSRHLAHSDQANDTPESRERRIAVAPPTETATERVSVSGMWTPASGALRTREAGARLKVRFTGNRLDLIGHKGPDGGRMQVLVDGRPGDQAPVYVTNSIVANQKHLWRSPHAVDLAARLDPQTWTITMTSDTGDYRVEGSVTGLDGTGNLATLFTGRSGQLRLDPRFWRQGRVERKGALPEYGVARGDAFTFDVSRAARAELSFKADAPGTLVEPLVRNLPNGEHTVELLTVGDGEVVIESLYVYQPPERE